MGRMSSEATEALIAQLDAVDDSPGAAALRARSYELLRAARGGLVVDVGCGAGRAVAELADQDLPVLGIDVSDQMIALARGAGRTASSASATPMPCRLRTGR